VADEEQERKREPVAKIEAATGGAYTVSDLLGDLLCRASSISTCIIRAVPARTHLAVLKVTPHVAEKCLNRKIKGVEDVHDRHDYFDERR
jgi:hypothetical protein